MKGFLALSVNNITLRKGVYRLNDVLFSGGGCCVLLCSVVNNNVTRTYVLDILIAKEVGKLRENTFFIEQNVEKIRRMYNVQDVYIAMDGGLANPLGVRGCTIIPDIYHSISNYMRYIFNLNGNIMTINGIRVNVQQICLANPILNQLRGNSAGEDYSAKIKKAIEGKIFSNFILSAQDEDEIAFGSLLNVIINILAIYNEEMSLRNLNVLQISREFLLNVVVFELGEILPHINAEEHCRIIVLTLQHIMDIYRRYQINFKPHVLSIGDIYALRGEKFSQYFNSMPPIKEFIGFLMDVARAGYRRVSIKTGFAKGFLEILPTPPLLFNGILSTLALRRVEFHQHYIPDPQIDAKIINIPHENRFFASRLLTTIAEVNLNYNPNEYFIQDDEIIENAETVDAIFA